MSDAAWFPELPDADLSSLISNERKADGRGLRMQTLTFVFAFIAVLALIGVAAWLVRRFATTGWAPTPIADGCRGWP